MSKLKIIFNAIGPDTIDCVPLESVESLDLKTLAIPEHTVSFHIEDENDCFVPPSYWIGEYAGGLDTFPERTASLKNGNYDYGTPSPWKHVGYVRVFTKINGEPEDYTFPLYDCSLIIDSDTREITWRPPTP